MRQAWTKRAFDVALLVPLGLAFWPLLLGLALFTGVSLGTPVLFKQIRPGKGGRPFTLYKFRTMSFARDERGRLLPARDRLPPGGLFLRKFSLDELPELWNVARGEMSFVGPRPLLMEHLQKYTPREARRHDMKPGVTGLAQVSGRNALTLKEKCELDVWYVEHWSLALDVRIILRTMTKVLRGEGVLVPTGSGSPGMEEVAPGAAAGPGVRARAAGS